MDQDLAREKKKKWMNPEETNQLLRFGYGHGSVYEEDTRTTQMLELLIPEKELIDHDQRLFQVVHLNTEMLWYTIHFEMRSVIKGLQDENYAWAVQLMERVVQLAEIPHAILRMFTSTLTQFSLLRMRAHLPAGASGFDSPGMRNLKLVASVLWKTLDQALARHGHTAVSFALLRAKQERVGVLPDRLAQLAQIYTGIQQFDIRLMEWKQLHLRMVWEHLGGAFAFSEHGMQKEMSAGDGYRVAEECSAESSLTEEEPFSIPTSLRGRPITHLQRVVVAPLFPALWKVTDRVYQELTTKGEG